MKHSPPILGVLLLTSVCSAQYLDSRNRAMGGTGVASSHYAAAGFINPALLTRFESGDRFGFIVPSVSAQIADEDDLVNAIEDFQDEIDRAQAAISNGSITPAQRNSLEASLFNLNGKTAALSLGAGFSFAKPSKTFAWSISASSHVDALVTPVIDPADAAIIQTTNNPNDLENLASEGRVVGIGVAELGFSVATGFSFAGVDLAIGATPKIQRIETYNYSININTFDDNDFDDSRYRNDSTEFNFDLGVAATVLPGLTFGLAARNLIEHEFETVVINSQSFTGKVGPQARLGAAWKLGGLTLAGDIDVVEVERFKQIDFDTRFVNLGVEFDTLGWLQLRAGYQNDLENTVEDLFSAGLGFTPAGLVHIDLTGVYGQGQTYGAAFQLWFTF